MSTYNPANKEVLDLVDEILHRYEEHEQLVEIGVKLDVLMAYGKENKSGEVSAAIKHHGVKAIGLMKRNGLKERVLGHGDALLTIDGNWYATASDAERRALIDHELYHLDLKRDETMAVEVDDAQRPKILLRPHTHEFGWFALIAKRHGQASQECKQMAEIVEVSGQYLLPGMGVGALLPPDEEASSSVSFATAARQLAQHIKNTDTTVAAR
jgi:hypothetical protein